MQNMHRKIAVIIFFFAFFIFMAIESKAGMGPPGPPMGPPPCWPPPCTIPIDGGISFLIAAAAALGGKKLFDSRKKSE